MHLASEPDLVDGRVLLALREFRVPDEPDPALEVVETFLNVTPIRLELLRQAAQRGDATDVQAIAHMMLGSSGTVGAVAMYTAAARLEALGTVGEAETLVAALEALFDRTRPLLEAFARAGDGG